MNAKDALEALQNAPPVKMVRFLRKRDSLCCVTRG